MNAEKTVYLFRSGDESDPYEEALEGFGYAPVSIPVLEFELVNGEALRQALEHPRSYDGVIFTSPRAVDALAEAMSWLPTENMVWHSKPVFAVGPKTADELRQIGFDPTGEGSGSAALLADQIARSEFERPLLFLCGNRRRDELPDRLGEAGVALEELCVYESRARRDLDLASHRPPDWVVFFSPSGVEAVRKDGSINLKSARVAAIGSTTAEALMEDGVVVQALSKEPTPDGLAQALAAAEAAS